MDVDAPATLRREVAFEILWQPKRKAESKPKAELEPKCGPSRCAGRQPVPRAWSGGQPSPPDRGAAYLAVSCGLKASGLLIQLLPVQNSTELKIR